MKNAKKRAPSISIRWQLMFFIGAMTLLTVGLIWGIITYALAPKYNATIRQNLTNKASAITAILTRPTLKFPAGISVFCSWTMIFGLL